MLRAATRLLALTLALLAPEAQAQQSVPALQGRVTDLTATLTEPQRAALESTLAAFERRKGAQVAVLIIASTTPESVEQYAVRVQESWKLGRKHVDDGVLLVVAKDDRRLRIEVGYGLEGVIPDAIAKRIIDQDITPRFRQGDFHGGIEAGTRRIVGLIDGEALPAPGGSTGSEVRGDFFENLIFASFVVMILGGALRAVFGRLLGATAAALGAAGIAWFAAGAAFALVLGVVAFVVTLLGGRAGLPGGGRHGGGFGGRGGFGGGFGGGGFSGGGGGFGGGGFSGGGGGSGGGGASGGW
jgi:uncharacterized protein